MPALKQLKDKAIKANYGLFNMIFKYNINITIVDCRGAVARVRDSYTDDPSSIPVRLVVASWG